MASILDGIIQILLLKECFVDASFHYIKGAKVPMDPWMAHTRPQGAHTGLVGGKPNY